MPGFEDIEDRIRYGDGSGGSGGSGGDDVPGGHPSIYIILSTRNGDTNDDFGHGAYW
jgi:hypothetical protein